MRAEKKKQNKIVSAVLEWVLLFVETYVCMRYHHLALMSIVVHTVNQPNIGNVPTDFVVHFILCSMFYNFMPPMKPFDDNAEKIQL